MSAYDTRALEANREFLATVDQIVTEAGELPSRAAGLLYTGLVVATKGAEEVGDSGGSTVVGP